MFNKFKSIENHYQEKSINDMLKFNPVYHSCAYVAQEKVDGANFQIKFVREDGVIDISYGKRTAALSMDEKFENFQHVTAQPHIQALEQNVCEWMINTNTEANEVIVYGELYGKGIQGRINYGDKKDLIFYDICINGDYISPKAFYDIMAVWKSTEIAVPVVAIFETLDEALAFEVEHKITFVGVLEEDNFWEGVVIKPWDTIARNNLGEQVLFYIKKKTVDFGEKMKVKKHKAPVEVSQAFQDAEDIYSSYITENRLKSVFSQYGMIQSQKDMGAYIKHMVEDAKTDFFKDEMERFLALEPKEKAKLFSCTGKIVSVMLRKYV